MKPLTIGVLGGIGPEASAEYYAKLILALQRTGLIKQNSDYPRIVVNSINAPEPVGAFDEAKLVPCDVGLRQLASAGADFIVMCCNTVHLYFDRFSNVVDVPILDLRAAVRDELVRRGARTPLILGTPSTVHGGLYRVSGCVEPNDEELSVLMNAIVEFNAGHEKDAQVQKVRAICERYLANGADVVLLGCTEFAVMLGPSGLPVINTIDILVDATVKRFKKVRGATKVTTNN